MSSDKIAEIKLKVTPALKEAGVRRSAIFGSFARGEESVKSDVDILIEFQGEKSLLDLVALQNELSRILNRKVDVVTYKSISPFLRDRILNEQVLIYG